MIESTPSFNENYIHDIDSIGIFLAGTIDMGHSFDWQREFIDYYRGIDNIVIYNPRRADYDTKQKSSPENPYFRNQVEWELDRIERSDIIAFNLQPNSSSPISLLELGLITEREAKVFVYCPRSYARYGNVHITCQRYGIPFYEEAAVWKSAIDSEAAMLMYANDIRKSIDDEILRDIHNASNV